MSLVTHSAGRIALRIAGPMLGFVVGMIVTMIAAVISSVSASATGGMPAQPHVSPLPFVFAGWAVAEAVLWTLARRAPSVPASDRPVPHMRSQSDVRTVYPSQKLPHLPRRTPDPDTADLVRNTIEELRRRSRAEDAEYLRRLAEREGSTGSIEHEVALRPLMVRAEKNLALSLGLMAATGVMTLIGGFGGSLSLVPVFAVVWGLLTLARIVFRSKLARPGYAEARRIMDSSLSIDPFSARGSVGGNLSAAVAEFGQGLVDMGTAGEVRTAQTLDGALSGINRIAVFHSLRFPGLDRADIDHAILLDSNAGPVVVVLDSKAWKRGIWEQTGIDEVHAHGTAEVRSSIMPLAIEKSREVGLPVARAMTVIHASSGSVEVHGAEGAQHEYVDSETLLARLLSIRLGAPALRTLSDPASREFQRVSDDLSRRLVR